MYHNLLVLVILLGLCAVPVLLALPITSKPYGLSPDHLAWDTFGESYGDDSLEPNGDGYNKPKKIHPKSIFIAPTLNSVSTCGPGYRTDHRGNCIETVEINHNQLLLNQLTQLLSNHNNKDEDTYDYDYDYEVTSPSTKDAQKGPLQLTIPVQLESDPQSPPQALQHQQTDPFSGSTTTTMTPPTAATTTMSSTLTFTTTTETPLEKLTSFLETLLPINKDPFGLDKKKSTLPWPQEEVTTNKIVAETTMSQTETETDNEPEESTTIPVTGTNYEPSQYTETQGGSWTTSEFATELADEQLVPVTSTSWDVVATTSDSELLLSNAEGTTLYAEEDAEVTTETRDAMTSSDQATVKSEQQQPSRRQQEIMTTTMTYTPEATETVLPVQVTEVEQSPPTRQPQKSVFDWRSKPIAIVTPVPNPFPFQRTSVSGSLFKFTQPITRRTTTTEAAAPSTTESVPELLLGVENESENSHKMRESLIESEQKEVNYENIDVNNRFIYHHLNGAPSSSSTTPEAQSTMSSIVVDGEDRISTEDNGTQSSVWPTTTTPPRTSTPSFAEKLAALLRPKESDRRRVSSASLWSSSSSSYSTPRPFVTSTVRPETTTRVPFSYAGFQTSTSKFEDFLRSSSNRIRFPGPSVNRQPAPNKLVPNGQRSSQGSAGIVAASGNKDKKPFWWFPSGWEVDTKQKEKAVLLRFWSQMPLIPDNVATQRRSSNYSRSTRENSKSPSENLYREVAIQDISKAFQERPQNGGS